MMQYKFGTLAGGHLKLKTFRKGNQIIACRRKGELDELIGVDRWSAHEWEETKDPRLTGLAKKNIGRIVTVGEENHVTNAGAR